VRIISIHEKCTTSFILILWFNIPNKYLKSVKCSHCSGVIKEYKWPRITPKNMDSRCAAIHILWCVLCGYATGKDTREGKIGHSAAARETGSTASAKHSGHSVGKTTRCCQWQSLSITCCRRLISGVGVYVIRGYLNS